MRLGVYSAALDVTQNNVTNANTPGYARQIATLQALPFDIANGLLGASAWELRKARAASTPSCRCAISRPLLVGPINKRSRIYFHRAELFQRFVYLRVIAPDISALFTAFLP